MPKEMPLEFVTGIERRLTKAVVATESPFSYVQQVQDFGGERWEFTIDMTVEGRAFEAFANSVLNARAPFIFRDPSIRMNNVDGLMVSGAGQTGNSLNVTGAMGGISLRAGDFFSIVQGGYPRLYQLTEDVVPVGTSATLKFTPRLRQSPQAGAAIEVRAPAVTLRTTQTVSASIGNVILRFSIPAVEVL